MKNMFVTAIVLLFALGACGEGTEDGIGSRLDDAAADIQDAAEDLCEGVANAVAANDDNC